MSRYLKSDDFHEFFGKKSCIWDWALFERPLVWEIWVILRMVVYSENGLYKEMIFPALGLKSFEKRVCASIKWAFIHQKGRKNHISTKVSPVIFTVHWKAANCSHFQQASGYIKFPDICNLIVCTNSLIKDFAFEIGPFVRDHFFGRYEWFCTW